MNRTFRHRKRGTTYELIGYAEVQSEFPVPEGAQVAVYRGEDGKLWARPYNEFHDKRRFEEIPTPPEPECDLEYLPSSKAGHKP